MSTNVASTQHDGGQQHKSTYETHNFHIWTLIEVIFASLEIYESVEQSWEAKNYACKILPPKNNI